MHASPAWELQCPVPASVVEGPWEDWRIALQPIPAFVDWYRKHKLSGTLLVTAFVIVKGYVVARGDITTALGIVQYAGVAGWVVAAILSSLPTLAAAMLAITFYQILWPLIGRRLANLRQLVPVVVVAFLICASLTPWPVVLAAVVLGLLCSFPPHGGLSDIYDAPTAWAWVTTNSPLLHSLGPVHGEPCIKLDKRPPHPINWLSIIYWLLIGCTGVIVLGIIATGGGDTYRKARSVSIRRPYGRRPWLSP